MGETIWREGANCRRKAYEIMGRLGLEKDSYTSPMEEMRSGDATESGNCTCFPHLTRSAPTR